MKNWIVATLFLLIGCSQEVDEKDIVDVLKDGQIVEIDDGNVMVSGENIGILKSNVVTEGCFGYEWCVEMNGTKGRAIATSEAICTYLEAGSEQYPGDIGGVIYFNKEYYPNYDDSDVSHLELRGKVAAWGPGWNSIRIDYCGGPTYIYCNPEED